MINLFNEAYYLAHNQDVAAAVARGEMTAEQHFNLFGKAEGRAPGPLFDPAYYLSQNSDVATAVAAGLISAYDHFIHYGVDENRSPLALFDPDWYVAHNADVRTALDAGLTNAVHHLLTFGHAEGRLINPFIDLGAYLRANPDVAGAAQGGASALGHLLQYGLAEGRDMGNGIDAGIFANDPTFKTALEDGDEWSAMERVMDVAPFLPTFKPVPGWVAPADTPIPVDFIPPEGMKLVVPPSVKIPPELLPLPDTFEPVDDGGGGHTRTFRLDFDGDTDTYTFGGTARGEIEVEIVDDVVSFARQGVTAKQIIDLDEWIAGTTTIDLKSRDTLVLTLADVEEFADAGMSDCGCIQHEVFSGTGLVRLNTTTIGDNYVDLTLFSPALSLDFNGGKAVTVKSSLQLHARHADGLLITNQGMVGVLPEETSNGVTLDVSSSLDDHAVTIIGATDGDDTIGINGSRLTIIDSGNGDDVIEIDGSGDPEDCGCPALSLNIISAGEGNDEVTLEGAALSILHAGTGGDEITLSKDGLALMMVATGSHDESEATASDSFWSDEGGTWDIIKGFEFSEDTDDAFNGVFILIDDEPHAYPIDNECKPVDIHLDGGTIVSFTVMDGVATITNGESLTLGDIVKAMAEHIGAEKAMVAFNYYDGDTENAYFFLSDGVKDLDESDTFIQLTNTPLTDIDSFLPFLSWDSSDWFDELDDWAVDMETWPDDMMTWFDDAALFPWQGPGAPG